MKNFARARLKAEQCWYLKLITLYIISLKAALVAAFFMKTATAESLILTAYFYTINEPAMTMQEVMAQLEKLGSEKMRQINKKTGAGDNQFGVKMGDIRNVAKKIRKDHALALQLWNTGNVDAQLVAALIMDTKKLTLDDMNTLVTGIASTWVADWFNSYILKEFPDKEKLREKWMKSKHPMTGRSGWSLMSGRVVREPEGIDLPALLDRIEKEMPKAAPETQWTMNSTLAQIGIHFPEHRKRAIALGEKLGIYRDYPVSKGCTSPFAPIWIEEMVKRQK